MQATSANQPPPSDIMEETEIETLTEHLVSSHEQRTILLLNKEQVETSKDELEGGEKSSIELSSEMDSIISKVLEDLVVEGSMDAEMSEQIVQSFAERRGVIVRDHQALKQKQFSRLAARMSMKKKERKQQLRQKQTDERKAVWSKICLILFY